MRARKGGHRYVYADPGTDFEREALEDSLSLTPKEPVIDDAPVVPEKLCPHDGVYFNDVPRCGFCFQEASNGLTPEDSFNAFQLSLYDICKRAAYLHSSFQSIPWKDKVQHAFSVLIEPKNMLKLLKARNPHGLAYRMANYRLDDLIKRPVYWREWAVSKLKFPEAGDAEGGEDFSTNTARFDALTAPSETDYVLESKLLDGESVRRFPGVELIWTPANIRRLMDLVNEAMKRLPTTPFSMPVLIKLRAGCMEGCGNDPWTWEEAANFLSPGGGKKVTVDQVRYAFATGTALIRRHIMRSLIPGLGEVTDRKLMIPQGVK
jgi:hypothetical protein